MSWSRIRIGNQTAASAARWDQPWRYALEQGFDAFEWFPDRPEGSGGFTARGLSRAQRWRIKRQARKRELGLSVHATLAASLLRPDGVRLLEEDVDLALDLDARLFNLHLELSSGVDTFVEALPPLLARLGRAGTVLALENTVQDGPMEANAVFAALRAAGLLSDGLVGLCLDVGHANLCAATRNDFLGFVDQLDEQIPIVHLHLHENFGDRDSHLTVFTGPAGVDPTSVAGLLRKLRKRGFDGHIILEQWPDPPELLVEARRRLLSMWQAAGSARSGLRSD